MILLVTKVMQICGCNWGGCGQVVVVFVGKWIGGLAVNGVRRNNLLSTRISERSKRAF